MMLDPRDIADPDRRLACPQCGASAFRERVAGRPGETRWRAECSGLDCRWNQYVAVEDGHQARTIVSPLADAGVFSQKLEVGAIEKIHRPGCTVGACRALAIEGGLCETHLSAWRVAGQPADKAAWIRGLSADSAGSTDRTHRGDRANHPQPSPLPESPMTAPSESSIRPRKGCVVPGCERPHLARGLCSSHSSRWYKAGKPEPMADWIADQPSIGPRRGRLARGRNGDPPPGDRPQPSPPPPPKLPPTWGSMDNSPAPAFARPASGTSAGSVDQKTTPAPKVVQAPPEATGAGAHAQALRVAIDLAEFLDIELVEPTASFRVGLLGRFLTFATDDGRILAQMPL